MKQILTSSFTVILLAGMFVLLGFIRQDHDNTVCGNIRISIEYTSSDTLVCRDEIRNLLLKKFDTLEGSVLHPGDLSGIREVISGIPYIKTCDVDFLLNGTLRIKARQRVPILRVVTTTNSWFIDEQGVVMPRHASFSARVPVASGNLGQTAVLKSRNNLYALADTNSVFKNGKLFQVIQLADYIHRHKLLNELVEQIFIDQWGEIVLFTHMGSQRIIFGSTENMEAKFNKLLHFYRAGPYNTGLHQYKTINLKYNNQIVCSKT
jgi:cell division protein FtsQ